MKAAVGTKKLTSFFAPVANNDNNNEDDDIAGHRSHRRIMRATLENID
jgi:hypothetical protein